MAINLLDSRRPALFLLPSVVQATTTTTRCRGSLGSAFRRFFCFFFLHLSSREDTTKKMEQQRVTRASERAFTRTRDKQFSTRARVKIHCAQIGRRF